MSKTIPDSIPFVTGPLAGYAQPDAQGRFGPVPTANAHGYYGGRFVAETLIHALDELNEAYARVLEQRVLARWTDHLGPRGLAQLERQLVKLREITDPYAPE